MTVAAVALAVALPAVIVLFLRHISSLERAWTLERRELLNRVQAPHRLPAPLSEPLNVPDRPADGWGQVGQIQLTKEWLQGED